jgi:hypothetical protein
VQVVAETERAAFRGRDELALALCVALEQRLAFEDGRERSCRFLQPHAKSCRLGGVDTCDQRGEGTVPALHDDGLDVRRAGDAVLEGRGRGGAQAAAPAGGGGRLGPPGPPGSGIPGDSFVRTADVTWDRAGNIYVADGYASGTGNARVAKFDKDAHFIKSWGSRGSDNGQFNSLRGIAVDAKGNVYVADAGNKRIQVFDGDGTFKPQIANIGVPSAICISPGAHQYLYSSNSNDADTLDNGEIYKLELDGTIVGAFGRAGKLPKEFGMVNAIDCRNENELFVGELMNWRVQKLTLRPITR